MGISSSVAEKDVPCLNPSITKVLPKFLDPRSPSEGIPRTPIEVACSPKVVDSKIETTDTLSIDHCNTPKSVKVDNIGFSGNVIKRLNINSMEQETESEQSGSEVFEGSISEVCLTNSNEVVYNNSVKNMVSNFESNSYNKNCDENDDNNEITVTAESGNIINEGLTAVEDIVKKPSSKKSPYLETDIDAIDGNYLNGLCLEHPRIKQLKKTRELNTSVDSSISAPSSTSDVSSGELVAKIDSFTLSELTSFDNLSLMVSDCEDVSHVVDKVCDVKSNVQDWLITIEDTCDSMLPFEDVISPTTRDALIKRNFSDRHNKSFDLPLPQNTTTPDSKRTLTTSAGRTPLGCVLLNKINEPIKEGSSLNKKQWRGIQEERQRRGLSLGDENTPPLPPPHLGTISSAPGKLMRRRNIVEWDLDNGSIIL